MAERFEIDPAHSSIGFTVKHLMVATVRGHFGQFSGYVESPDGQPLGATGEVTVEAATIDTGVEQRDQHLRSGDFLLTDEHPQITYRLESVEPAGGDRYRLHGDVTIRGVTRPLELTAQVEGQVKDPWGNNRLAVTVRGELNRKDFGANWNQALEAGGVVVGDTVKIEVELSLVHKLAPVAVG